MVSCENEKLCIVCTYTWIKIKAMKMKLFLYFNWVIFIVAVFYFKFKFCIVRLYNISWQVWKQFSGQM